MDDEIFVKIDFLFMAVLQTIPTLSPTGQFTAFFPLAFGKYYIGGIILNKI